MSKMNILDAYVRSLPSDQNAIDLFKGEWSSSFPPPFESLSAGTVPLFQDHRIPWALERLGSVQGQSVLELGPLEGGHAYGLQQAGAARVVAIEANSRAFIKCLIAQQILHMDRVRFLLGDFVAYLQHTPEQFDLIFASGVLYHMTDPVEVLRQIAAHCRRVYLWTHYFDPEVTAANPQIAAKFKHVETVNVDGLPVTLHRHDYLDTLEQKTYCGGGEVFSVWLEKDDILALLKQFGFSKLEVGHVNLQHPHGASFSVAASKP